MEIAEFLNIISNVGFPIACTIIMFYCLQKEQTNHKQEVNELRESIENNTKVMEKLLYHLEGKGTDND